MALFQKTVISKYLQTQSPKNLSTKWDLFRTHFNNPIIQENIRNSKEEQYQEGFLRDLFVSILGYQLNPAHNFNLTTEYKNVKDSKKADGAIIIDDKVTAIIELKGMNTTDLSKIEDQAFGYKNNQEDCKYVITSNFDKIRFYVDNAIEHIEFNLFELTQEQFNLMYLVLAFENIKNDVPKKLKDESLNQEDIVTKKLYKDYSVFKRELFQNLILLNPEHDPLVLFQKSQKLLDRLLFLLFGEDRGLLPPNSVRQILEQWNKLNDLDAYDPLYNRYKKYFGYLNTGFKGKNHDVFAYNGGLFKEDEILDHIKIDDKLLYDHTFRLSQYDFASEVDVNILGHIFENSLNEIDEIKAQLEGQVIDKSKSKRKKDGVFYTPKYITKYIVENTVGKLCEEKKDELGIKEEEYFSDKKRQQKTSKNLLDKLDHYRDWLLQITIVDPACGSGAFLNEALNFLINEHQYIDELEAKLRNVPIIFSYHSESILEHNLFGVDLNEESVEIAKLSLWLRTAEPNRKLNSLNDNIKCGNSLIDDLEVAGDKAFNWKEEFPQVFAKGGFDVVIGNPPYVRQELINKEEKEFLSQNFKVGNGTADLYVYFYETALDILKNYGVLGFITPNKFYKTKYGKELRQFLNNFNIVELVDFFELKVFEDASTDSQILILVKRNKPNNFNYSPIKKLTAFRDKTYDTLEINPKNLSDEIWVFNNLSELLILNKMFKNSISLNDYSKNGIYRGILTGFNEAFIIDEETKNKIVKEDAKSEELIKPYVNATEIERYCINYNKFYIITTFPAKSIDIELYKGVKNYLLDKFGEQRLAQSGIGNGRKKTSNQWFETQDSIRYYNKFEAPKIIYIYTAVNHKFYFDEENYYINNSSFLISNADKFLSVWLNSKIFSFYKKLNFVAYGDSSGSGRAKLDYNKMVNVPVPNLEEHKKQQFNEKADQILTLSKDLQQKSAKFLRTCERKFENLNLTKKLQDWYNLSYANFIKELAKQKIKLTLSEEAEWADYFDQEKSKALEIQSEIENTDKEIDQMVYDLYGLSEEEIEIVENSSK